MDPQSLELSKRAGRAAITYAGGVAVAYLVIGIVPCLGAFINFFLSLAAFIGIAYLITPKMTLLPPNQTRTMHALYIGIGVAVVMTAGFVIASLISGLIWMALATAISSVFSNRSVFGSATGGFINLVITLIVVTIWGLAAGTGLGMLGSYLAFNRMSPQPPPQQPGAMPPY